jgi:RimJ/RimL family protein N-acetyltransferase
MKIYDRFVVGKGGRKMKVVLRNPDMEDAADLCDFVNSIVDEEAKISITKRVTKENEKKYLKDLLRRIQRNSMLSVVAVADGHVIGKADLTRRRHGATSHVAELGVALSEEYRNIGIGSRLIKCIIQLSVKKWGTKVVILKIYEDNRQARRVYKKLGFRKVGAIPKGVKYKGKYYNHIIMAKVL